MLEAHDITYRYPRENEDALRPTTLTLRPGELVVVYGLNGSGKSTLAHVLAGSYAPREGKVLVDGEPLVKGRAQVGFVRQDPQSQLVCELVHDEVAFGPRNFDLAEEEVERRVTEALEESGISHLADMRVSNLSGGEQQRLALAGILAMHPRYLVLDEPMSQQDSTSVAHFMDRIAALVESGVGVLAVTHHLAVVDTADVVVVMSEGSIVWEGLPQEFAASEWWNSLQAVHPHGDAEHLDKDHVSADDRAAAEDLAADEPAAAGGPAPAKDHAPAEGPATNEAESTSASPKADATIKLNHVFAARGNTTILHDIMFHAAAGRVTLLSGRSGSGKTTLAHVMCGATPIESGTALVEGRPVSLGDVGLCMQRPEDQLFCDTVFDEVAYGPRNLGLSEDEVRERTIRTLVSMGVDESLWDRHPLQLSGGERRCVAIAGIASMRFAAYVFDEPTAGLDAAGREAMFALVRRLADDGAAVVVISHELIEWLGNSDELTLLAHGKVVYTGPSEAAQASSVPFRLAGLQVPDFIRENEDTTENDELYESLALTSDAPPKRKPRVTLLHRVPAGLKVLWILAMTVILFAFDTMEVTGVGFLVSIVTLALGRIKPRQALKVLAGSAIVLLFALVANVLVVDGSGDVALFGTIGVRTAGLIQGSKAVLRILSLVFTATTISMTTTATAIANALLAPLRLLGRGPFVESICLTVTLALRIIPIAYSEFKRIEMGQTIRKAPLRDKRLSVRLRAWVAVLAPVLFSVFSRAEEMGDALSDRGLGWRYTAEAKRDGGHDGGDR